MQSYLTFEIWILYQVETVALFLAMNRRVRSSKEPSINEQPFHISCSYLEWAEKKNADKKIKSTGS